MSSSIHDNVPSDSVGDGEFLDNRVALTQLLKEDSAPC
jgi:hypothetical protein